jgi:phosphopantothenoylcysteine decarboxylase/phosphopantothenate--cysteine ligase
VARVLVGVTGGIAAYKACEVVRLLVRSGHEVTPLLTAEAEGFIAARTFEALARRPQPDDVYPHLLEADLLVVAPLSANTLAKLAGGHADSVLTQTALAFAGPRLAAPAMNARMWANPATARNAETLLGDGWELVGPETGELAEGEIGVGRMSEPSTILERCATLLDKAVELAGRRVLVSAGGTREPLDSVRFVGNRSSGRMGVAVAAEAARRGASVTLVASNLAVPAPRGVELVEAPTAADVAREALERAGADVVVMAAAVGDYRPANPAGGKRPKDLEPWTVTLEPTQDVLAELGGRRRRGQVLVGFAADEGEGGLERARTKRESKGADLLVFNDVSRSDVGFDSWDNEVTLIGANGEHAVGKRSKEEIAVVILDEVSRLLKEA